MFNDYFLGTEQQDIDLILTCLSAQLLQYTLQTNPHRKCLFGEVKMEKALGFAAKTRSHTNTSHINSVLKDTDERGGCYGEDGANGNGPLSVSQVT